MFKHSEDIKKIARTLNKVEGMNAPKITKLFNSAKVRASLPSVYAWINKAEPKKRVGRPRKLK